MPTTIHRPRRVLARTVLFGCSALLAAGVLAWSPSATTGWNQGAAEGTLWQLLNGARVNNGMAPLQQNGTLVGLARWRSSDMLQRNYFSHTIAGTGCLVYCYYDQKGLNYVWAGENIGWNAGLDDSYSPVRVHERFMASPGHRANVLTAAFTHGGVGAAAADNREFLGYVQDTRMYTELFMQAPSARAPAPAPAQPAPAPAQAAPAPAQPAPAPAQPSGGGAAPVAAPAAQAAAPAQTPAPPKPRQMTVPAPSRPVSSAGIDGRADVVVQATRVDLLARIRADDALGMADVAADVAKNMSPSARPTLEVTAAEAPQRGLLENIVGALISLISG